jgi:hypothetical protein
MYEHFIALAPIATISSCKVQIGFRTEQGLFKNISATPYEIRSGTVSNTSEGRPAYIDVERDLEVQERGYEITIDVNNKPMFRGLAQRDDNIELLSGGLHELTFKEVERFWSEERA